MSAKVSQQTNQTLVTLKFLPRPKTRSTKNWLKAVNLIKDRADPWEEFHLDELKVEKAVRHHYSALNKTWSTEEVVVKMGNTSFAGSKLLKSAKNKFTSLHDFF